MVRQRIQHLLQKRKKYTNRDLKIIREATTKRGNWAQIQEGSKTLGWISKGSLTYLDKITSKKNA